MEPDFHYALARDLFEAIPEAGDDMRARPDNETPLAYIAAPQTIEDSRGSGDVHGLRAAPAQGCVVGSPVPHER